MVAAVSITRIDTRRANCATRRSARMMRRGRRMLALALVLEGKSRSEAARAVAWTGRFYAIGCTAITPKVWKGCTMNRSWGEAEAFP